MLTVAYAEIETRLKNLLLKRAAKSNDAHLERFVSHQVKAVTGRLKIGDLKDLLGRFGDDYQGAFSDALTNKECHAAWDNLISNRHLVSHSQGSNMTLNEFVDSFNKGCLVLTHFSQAIGLAADDIQDLQ